MKYRYLGNSGMAVSRVCLGTATFGQKDWGCDAGTSVRILNAFREQGGTFIDTSDQYAKTQSEQIIGSWLGTQARDELVIATKCFFNTSDNINSRGLSRKHIVSACEASLKRLGTDHIDLYQVHELDPQTPIEETMSALDMLVRQGKVLYIGCSNYPAWKVVKSYYISNSRGLASFISGQYLYNLLKRDIEAEILPACNDSGMSVICWSPLSGGVLTGKYLYAVEPPSGTRLARRTDIVSDRYGQWREKSQHLVKMLIEIGDRLRVAPSTVALTWLLGNKQIASVIVGATRPEQITENIQAADWEMPNQEWMELCKESQIHYGYPCDNCERVAHGWFEEVL